MQGGGEVAVKLPKQPSKKGGASLVAAVARGGSRLAGTSCMLTERATAARTSPERAWRCFTAGLRVVVVVLGTVVAGRCRGGGAARARGRSWGLPVNGTADTAPPPASAGRAEGESAEAARPAEVSRAPRVRLRRARPANQGEKRTGASTRTVVPQAITPLRAATASRAPRPRGCPTTWGASTRAGQCQRYQA